MQYKIPIQIENDDNIIFGFSLKQLGVVIVGVVIGYGIFTKLEPTEIPATVVFVLSLLVTSIFVFIAKFRTHEMGFLSFILNMVRWKQNGNGPDGKGRYWMQGVDSQNVMKIGYVRHQKNDKAGALTSMDPHEADSIHENISKL